MKRFMFALVLLSCAGSAAAARWQIEITNVTPGQTFTPILVAVHHGESGAVPLGEPASEGLSTIAEGGDPSLLAAEIVARRHGAQTQVIDGLLEPGATAEVTIEGRPGQRVTLAAMLIPTNDTFFAVDSLFLPVIGETTVQALAYDAGSEANDQNCANIPGPRCGGAGVSPVPAAGDEGFVHVSNSFHDLGTADASGNEILGPVHYRWNNPVAIVKIRRIHEAW